MGRPALMGMRSQKDQAHEFVLRGKYDDAIAIYRSLVTTHPDDSALHLQLAETCRKRGKLDDAVTAYRRASALLATAGHTARARAALSCALQLYPAEPVLVAALNALQPVRHLALVKTSPPPPVADAFDEDDKTDPCCPMFDWLEATPSSSPSLPQVTVWARPPRREGHADRGSRSPRTTPSAVPYPRDPSARR